MLNRDEETARLASIFGATRVAREFTLSNLDSMYSIVVDPPACLLQASQRAECSVEQLKTNLASRGVVLQTPIPYTELLHEMDKTLGPGISVRAISSSDHHRLLRALARAPENQMVLPILFVLYYAELCRRTGDPSIAAATGTGGGHGEVNMQTREMLSQLEMLLPDSMHVFGLIHTRLFNELSRIARVSDRMSVDILLLMMKQSAIIMSHSQTNDLLRALCSPGIDVILLSGTDAPPETGKVVASRLLPLCAACAGTKTHLGIKQRRLDMGTRAHVSHLKRDLQRMWEGLVHVDANAATSTEITADDLFTAAARRGLNLSTNDRTLLFEDLLCSISASGAPVVNTASIPYHALDTHMRADHSIEMERDGNAGMEESLLGGMISPHAPDGSSVPGKDEVRAQRRHVHSSRGDRVGALGYLQWHPQQYEHADPRPARGPHSGRLYGSGARGCLPWEANDEESTQAQEQAQLADSDAAGSSEKNHHPWMEAERDESREVNNVTTTVSLRLQHMTDETFGCLLATLEDLQSRSGTEGLTRGCIIVALAAVGVRLDRKHAAWMYSSCRDWVRRGVGASGIEPVTAAALFGWLDALCATNFSERAAAVAAAANMPPSPPPALPSVMVDDDDDAAPSPLPVPESAPSLAVALPPSPPRPVSRQQSPLQSATRSPSKSSVRKRDQVYIVREREGVSVETPRSPLHFDEQRSSYVSVSEVESQQQADKGAGAALSEGTRNRLRNKTSLIFGPTPPDTPDQEEQQYQGIPDLDSHASFYDSVNGSPARTSIDASPTPAASGIENAVIEELQQRRSTLALVFRRLTAAESDSNDSSSGLVRLQSFANALAGMVGGRCADLLRQDPRVADKIACDIQNVSYASNLSTTYIHITDVLGFLDAAAGEKQRGDQSSSILRRLKDKCHVSTCLNGEKLRMLMLTPQVRQRLKQRFLSGKSKGYASAGAGAKDYCGVHDLIDVFSAIEVYLSPIEARFLCEQSGDEGGNGSLDVGTTLAAAIRFLCENALS